MNLAEPLADWLEEDHPHAKVPFPTAWFVSSISLRGESKVIISENGQITENKFLSQTYIDLANAIQMGI